MTFFNLFIALLALFIVVLSADPPLVSWDAQNIVVYSAPDALHQAYLAIGTSTLCAMRSLDRGAGIQQGDNRNPPSAGSLWATSAVAPNRRNLYRAWKWDKVDPAPQATDFAYQGWAQAMAYLASNSPGPSTAWTFLRFKHWIANGPTRYQDQTYRIGTSGGPQFHCTGAIYQFAINVGAGTVFFQPAIAPKVATRVNWDHEATDGELPEFRARSDIAFMEWWSILRRQGTPKNALYNCAISEINDLATHRLIARYILARGMYDMQSWPASNSVFNTNTPEGLALLGSPAAQACVALLVQHKSEFGVKHIVSVTVFRGPAVRSPQKPNRWNVFPNMLFKIEDVPQQQLLPDPGPGFVPPPQVVVPDPRAGLPPRPNPAVAQPAAPQPVIPGPSTPGPNARSADRMAARDDPAPAIAYHFKQEEVDKNFVRTHTFYAVNR